MSPGAVDSWIGAVVKPEVWPLGLTEPVQPTSATTRALVVVVGVAEAATAVPVLAALSAVLRGEAAAPATSSTVMATAIGPVRVTVTDPELGTLAAPAEYQISSPVCFPYGRW